MFAVRTATVALMASILLCAPTTRPRQSGASTCGVQGAVSLRANSSIALVPLARLSRHHRSACLLPGGAGSRSFWKRRTKKPWTISTSDSFFYPLRLHIPHQSS